MKSSDIEIGKTYGYARYSSRGSSLATNPWLAPITVTDIRKEKVHNKTTYGYRVTTMIIGTNSGGEVKVEPKHVLATWAEVLEARKKHAEYQAKAADAKAQRLNEVDAQLQRLEQILRDRGVEPTVNDYLGVVYINNKTGEARQDRPEDYWVDNAPSGEWEYTNYSPVKTYFDREEILHRGKKIELTPAALLALLEG